ncbi:MAG: hypothetical protein LAT50_22465, partial [Ectothiorhodospiraceae bacterium]|nr:hypothetical protein [Ectothiorhodospiraceae bacterium]
MTHSISLSWSAVEATIPQTPVVPPAQLSNLELVRRCQLGARPDRAGCAELLRRYQSYVDKVLYHLAPDWQDRSDLAPEGWMRVYRNVRRLQDP